MVPGYLKTFRKVVWELQNGDKSDKSSSEAQPPGDLLSLKSLLSHPPASDSFSEAFAALERRCPEYISHDRWGQAVEDGRRFLAQWGNKAQALGWTPADLFSLHQPPPSPHPSYRRLSRYDSTGVIWLLEGREVIALTADTATIKTRTELVAYRKHNKPGLGPLGDSLIDLV